MAIREGFFYSIVTMIQKDKHLHITVAHLKAKKHQESQKGMSYDLEHAV